jgi:hypothetical protein
MHGLRAAAGLPQGLLSQIDVGVVGTQHFVRNRSHVPGRDEVNLAVFATTFIVRALNEADELKVRFRLGR